MKRLLITVLLMSMGLSSIVFLGGCSSKDTAAITPDKKADFGTANQQPSDKAKAGMAEMMAKHNNGAPPAPPAVK